jgi:kynurenine 3-monooxygenase
MVTFHRLPYSMALSRGKIQDRILMELCGAIESVEALNWEKAAAMIQESLPPLSHLRG